MRVTVHIDREREIPVDLVDCVDAQLLLGWLVFVVARVAFSRDLLRHKIVAKACEAVDHVEVVAEELRDLRVLFVNHDNALLAAIEDFGEAHALPVPRLVAFAQAATVDADGVVHDLFWRAMLGIAERRTTGNLRALLLSYYRLRMQASRKE